MSRHLQSDSVRLEPFKGLFRSACMCVVRCLMARLWSHFQSCADWLPAKRKQAEESVYIIQLGFINVIPPLKRRRLSLEDFEKQKTNWENSKKNFFKGQTLPLNLQQYDTCQKCQKDVSSKNLKKSTHSSAE